MDNYLSLFVATLEHLELIPEKEADKLAQELRTATLPGTYKEARVVVKDIFDRIHTK